MKKSTIPGILVAAALAFATLPFTACTNSSGGPDDDLDGDTAGDYTAPDMGSPSDIASPTIPAGLTVTAPTEATATTLLASSMDALSDMFSPEGSASVVAGRKIEKKTVDLATLSSTGFTVTGSMKAERDSTDLDDHETNPPETGDAFHDYKTCVVVMDAKVADKATEAGEDGHSFRLCGKESLKMDFASKEDGTYERIQVGDPSSYVIEVNKSTYTESAKLGFGIAFFVLRDDGLAAKFILSYAAEYNDTGSEEGEEKSSRAAMRGGDEIELPTGTLKVYNALDNTLIASKELSGDEVLAMIPAAFLHSEESKSEDPSDPGDGSK